MILLTPCHCGHTSAVHAHYRGGTDCALCDCRRYQRARPTLLARIAARLRARQDDEMALVNATREPREPSDADIERMIRDYYKGGRP